MADWAYRIRPHIRIKYRFLSRQSKQVEQSHYRPRQALKVTGGYGSQISRQDSQPYAPFALTPGKYSWFSFLVEAESTPGP
jgi:hypothetical protein